MLIVDINPAVDLSNFTRSRIIGEMVRRVTLGIVPDNPAGISVSLQVEHKQFIEMGTSSAHRLGEPHTSSPRYAIGRVTTFSKTATGKTDVSFDI